MSVTGLLSLPFLAVPIIHLLSILPEHSIISTQVFESRMAYAKDRNLVWNLLSRPGGGDDNITTVSNGISRNLSPVLIVVDVPGASRIQPRIVKCHGEGRSM